MEFDSLQLANNDFVRRIHSTRTSGKLHRGHNITAATSSIPSKYQTIVIDNSDNKGFLAKARRFKAYLENDNPGPGSYCSQRKFERESNSYSKKGTGALVSKDRRIGKLDGSCAPGANAYTLPSMLQTRKEFNKKSTTGVFSNPIAHPKAKSGYPAPNAYAVTDIRMGKRNNVTADAAFKSKTRREMINLGEAKNKPAPCHYHISDDLVKDSVKVPYSSFRSTAKRQIGYPIELVPGPGTYKPHEPIEPVPKTVFPKKHYLCISAPAMPLPETPPFPGPGQYETKATMGGTKHFMSGSAFVSTTSRWTGDGSSLDQPGPAHYRPTEAPGKQSFIYNSIGRWI